MKRRFTFKLARLLRVRSIQEEVARAEWATAQAEAVRAEDHLAALTDQLREDRRRLSADLLAHGTGPGVLSNHTALDAQLRGIEGAASQARTARSRAEELVLIWRGREQDRRALAKLSERGYARHKLELDREEEVTRDDTFLGRRSADSQGNSSADLSQADGERSTGIVFPLTSDPLPVHHQAPR